MSQYSGLYPKDEAWALRIFLLWFAVVVPLLRHFCTPETASLWEFAPIALIPAFFLVLPVIGMLMLPLAVLMRLLGMFDTPKPPTPP